MSRHPTVILDALACAHGQLRQHQGNDTADVLAREILGRRFDRLLDELNDSRQAVTR